MEDTYVRPQRTTKIVIGNRDSREVVRITSNTMTRMAEAETVYEPPLIRKLKRAVRNAQRLYESFEETIWHERVAFLCLGMGSTLLIQTAWQIVR